MGQLSPRATAPPTRLPGVLALPAPPLCCLWPQRLFLALLVASPGSLSMWPQVEGDGEVNSASPWTVAGNVQPPLTLQVDPVSETQDAVPGMQTRSSSSRGVN